MNIKPVAGRLVKDPATGREVTASITVPDGDPFWLRRLADGDVALDEAHADVRPESKPADKPKRADA